MAIPEPGALTKRFTGVHSPAAVSFPMLAVLAFITIGAVMTGTPCLS